MFCSMTGFGRGKSSSANFEIEAEVKSLNNRYLDISLRLPKELYNREFELRDKIKSAVSRGKITLSVNLKRKENAQGNEFLNKDALINTINLVEEIRKTASINDEIKLEHLLSLQAHFMEDLTEIDEETFQQILLAVDEALNGMLEMREKEGRELREDFQKRLNFIEEKVNEIESLLDGSIKNYFEKLKERAKNLLADFSQYDDRLKLELALIAEKYDVSEEIVRMKSHIKQFLKILNATEAVGKKMVFLIQEMNREANTINNKSISTEISYRAIAIKEELEKMREQAQNIE